MQGVSALDNGCRRTFRRGGRRRRLSASPAVSLCSLFLLLLLAVPARAQQSDEQLAAHYFGNGDFAQASQLYEGLYNRYPNQFYYRMLFRSYAELEQFSDAERLARRRLRQYPNELGLYVDLGSLCERRGERKKAVRHFEEALEHVGFDGKQISELAQAFETAGRPEYAIRVYLRVRQKSDNRYLFVGELAGLYERTGNYEQMMLEYLDLLEKQPAMMNSVQVSLSRVLAEASAPSLAVGLRDALVSRIQQHPDNQQLLEMMIWFSIQQKDFAFALQQARAVDRRFPEQGGEVLLRVASIARSNEAFDVAEQCYAVLVGRGPEHPHYFDSRVGLLEVRFDRLNRNFPIENRLLQNLVADYESALNELGKNVSTAQLMRNCAQLLAYYADSVQPAADLLYDLLALPKLPSRLRDEVKLELGDLLLFAGEVWDASLLFMQVEKANKNDILGSQAKFRNARLSYFNHDFLWAVTQLNVLRASTSKLIANDAMELSLLISDNMEEDSTFTLLEQYAAADLMLYQNRLDSAWEAFDRVASSALSHPLFDEVLLQKARIRIRQQHYAEADSLLQQLIDLYPDDLLADDALFLLAQLNEERLSNPQRASSCYERLLLDYPLSLYADQSRKRLAALKTP